MTLFSQRKRLWLLLTLLVVTAAAAWLPGALPGEKEMLKITQIPGIKSAGAPYCWEFAEFAAETEDLYFAIPVTLDPSYFTDEVREEMVSYYRG